MSWVWSCKPIRCCLGISVEMKPGSSVWIRLCQVEMVLSPCWETVLYKFDMITFKLVFTFCKVRSIKICFVYSPLWTAGLEILYRHQRFFILHSSSFFLFSIFDRHSKLSLGVVILKDRLHSFSCLPIRFVLLFQSANLSLYLEQ